MLTPILAHPGQPPAPHDAWGAWTFDPLVVTGLLLLGWAYRRGLARRRAASDAWRVLCFSAALAALAVALVSPLDAVSGALASAHMVQHVLLVAVAAPLLAVAAPGGTLLRGSPPVVQRGLGRWRRRLGLTPRRLRLARHPVAVWLAATATLWLWHAAALYDAALGSAPLHVAEHATLLGTALLLWRVVVDRAGRRAQDGVGVLLVFATALQSVFLSLLLTFARTAWYAGYATTTAPWGLTPLADQQLAGVIMWVPAGAIHVAAGLALLLAWLRATDRTVAALERQAHDRPSGGAGSLLRLSRPRQ